MPTKLRELMLLRHAKSEWKNSDLADIERPLSDRGKKNASKMSKWLKSQALVPDLILVSPAQRAQQTLRRICNDCSVNTITVDSLYLADLTTLQQILAETPQAERVMIIGHNPSLEKLFEYLQYEESQSFKTTASTDTVTLFPTTSLAHFILPNDWSKLDRGDGKLVQFIRPKDLKPH